MICVKGKDWEKYRNVRGGTARLFWLFFFGLFYIYDYELFFGEDFIYMVDYGKWDCVVEDRPSADCIST